MADDDDVPIHVDFRDRATARAWIEDTRVRRPYRPRFFAAFCAALSRNRLRILELGSGPGQLAREILIHCDVQSYVALDFSPAMHELAAEHLGELASRVTFVTRDFREPGWPSDLGGFDAIVTLQAAHETRHKRHLVPLLERARTLVAPGGVLLYADHYLTPDAKLPALLAARADQPLALERAGFVDIELRYEEGTMALWSRNDPALGCYSYTVTKDWTARTVAQLVGWGLIIFGVVFVCGGFVGEGGGAGQETGSDTIRTLIFERSVGQAALVSAGLGAVVLLSSLFMRKSA